MNAPPPPSATLVAGKYQLVQIIGRGGMGTVWEGRHVSLGTRVAIKFIEIENAKDDAGSAELRRRFDNEAHAAARIQSKYAIQIFDHGITDDGKPFIVMEYLEGEPLDRRLDRVKRLPLTDVARILNQVSRALARAHESHVYHRDLKPENIFLVKTPDDDEEIAKVLDFGVAKIRGAEGQALSNSTKTGAVLGTPYYMSPEQARGLRDLDHRSDLWSLGVIVFKCVTGVLPFDGQSLGDLLVKICTSPLPVPSHVMPGLPPAFDSWFARALDRDPNNRFASATEMSDALSFAFGLSVKRGPSSNQLPPAQGEYSNARTAPSQQTPGFMSGQGGPHATPQHYATGPGHSAQVPQFSASGGVGGSNPGRTPVPFDSRNVTAAGLSASANGPLGGAKRSALPWLLGGAGLVVGIIVVIGVAFFAGEHANRDKGTAARPASAISIQVQAGAQPPTTATTVVTAEPPASAATTGEVVGTTAPTTTSLPPNTTPTKPPSGAHTGKAPTGTTATTSGKPPSGGSQKPAGGVKPGAGDPGF